MTGTWDGSRALQELKSHIMSNQAAKDLQESAKNCYAIGLINSVMQYNENIASAKDLCMNVRDAVLVMGRIKLSDKIYEVVKRSGQEFSLLCESGQHVSCMLKIPDWLDPVQYVHDVYSLKLTDVMVGHSQSAGDKNLLKHTIFTSYKSFEQKMAVHTALNLPPGHTLLVSQPTGGGKSLVTQMIASSSDGLTVVIVPTVALALDQYYAARHNMKNHEEIYCYRGDQSAQERVSIISALKHKSARVLFTSPEAIFKNQELYRLLDEAATDRYLDNIVIDEAHVVPDWGVFFRPDFQISSITIRKWRRKSGNHIRTFLLSATLSDEVVDTLFSLFGGEGQNAQVRCDALRHEPRYYFHSVKSREEQIEKTIEAMRLLPKPMVIYVLEPKEAKELQKRLRKEGFKNIPVFSGETKESDRDTILQGWKENKFDVVVATSAFGIGVDKPDVRTIIHACCPENLSRFYQEVGRGGRDQLPSLSLFLPYQSQHDGQGDVRRALGLVNKRVLTVEQSINRWKGLLAHPSVQIYGDICFFDTSATPPTMTFEEAEYAGNRNIAWNVNLLLFLHRTGFIDLVDAAYVPENNSYILTVELLKPDILGDDEALKSAIQEPRKREYDIQMEGYHIIRDLVAAPKAKCWGRVFKHLFPLSREVCNGCPVDKEGRVTTDETYKLRNKPEINLKPEPLSSRLHRNMGSFNELHVGRSSTGPCTEEEVEELAIRCMRSNIGAMILPDRLAHHAVTSQLVMSYDEFHFAADHCPYLFAKGVLCIFENNSEKNLVLYENLSKLERYGYSRVLYGNENIIVTGDGKTMREYFDGYTIPLDKL